MHGGQGHQLTDVGVKAPDKGLVYIFEQGQAANRRIQALLPEGALARILHGVEKIVDDAALYARQVIAHTEVELEAVVPAELPGKKLDGDIGFYVFLHGLPDGELGGPLGVVCLVFHVDAGLYNAKLLAHQYLHRLQLEDAGSGGKGGEYVLGQLGVGTGGGAHGDRYLPACYCHGAGHQLCMYGYVEQALVPFVFGDHSLQQGFKRNASHFIAHVSYLRKVFPKGGPPACGTHTLSSLRLRRLSPCHASGLGRCPRWW